jgi:hypothetical protein
MGSFGLAERSFRCSTQLADTRGRVTLEPCRLTFTESSDFLVLATVAGATVTPVELSSSLDFRAAFFGHTLPRGHPSRGSSTMQPNPR